MKSLFRIVGFLLGVAAFVLLVVDGTTMIAGRSITLTSTGEVLARLLDPASLSRWQALVSQKLHPLVWSAFGTVVLAVPAMISTLLGAIVFAMLGRKREPDFDLRARDDA